MAASNEKMTSAKNATAFEQLCNKMVYAIPGSGSKIIGISRVGEAEFNSAIVWRLCAELAKKGKRVILLDADLECGFVPDAEEDESVIGLSEVLTGQGSVENAISKDDELGFDVLLSGAVPPDTFNLLDSEQMQIMLKVFRKYYDYILINLPAINSYRAACTAANCSDGVALVVEHAVTKYSDIQKAMRCMDGAKVRKLGFIYHNAPKKTGKK